MKKNTIVSLADSNYFPLLDELIDSIKQFEASKDTAICVLDAGLSEEQKNKLLSKVDEILPLRKKDYVSGEDFIYMGKHYKLKVIKGKKYNVKLSDKYLILNIKPHTKDDKIKKLLKNWYFNNADKYLKEITKELSQKYSLELH